MAKEPLPGSVKTRLCPPLSHEAAARCHEAFVADTLERLRGAAEGRVDRELAVAPWGAAPRLAELAAAAGWRCVAQEGADLGARMRERLAAGIARGASVVLVGSDSPDLPITLVLQAFCALEENDVVLGPATDGGYYLIGCRGHVPDVFGHGIRWGGPAVLGDTRARLAAAGTKTFVLDPWPDVDDWAGLVALATRLRSAPHVDGDGLAPRATLALLERLSRQGLPL